MVEYMKKALFFILIFLMSQAVTAASFTRIHELRDLDNSTILDFRQEENGCISIVSREGIFSYNGYVLHRTGEPGGMMNYGPKECVDGEGNRYEVTGHGLYVTDGKGRRSEIALQGELGLPVTCVFKDRDGNIWAGTYYNGLFFKGDGNSCLDIVGTPSKMKNLRSLVCDSHKRVWAFTDNVGVYVQDLSTGIWREIPGFERMKFVNSCYDREHDRVWAVDSEKGLFSIDCRSFKASWHDSGTERLRDIYALLWTDEGLYIGGLEGLSLYDPWKNRSTVVDGISCTVYDLLQDSGGKVWIAGGGLFSIKGGKAVREDDDPVLGAEICHDIDIDSEGRVWVAVIGYGLACLDKGKVSFHDEKNCGLSSDWANTVSCTGKGKVVVGSRLGISVFDSREGTVLNFGENAGACSNTTSGRSSILLPDGSVWIGNSRGITQFRDSSPIPAPAPAHDHPLSIDRILIDGQNADSVGGRIVLRHGQNGLSIYLSDYDYEGNTPRRFEMRTSGRGNTSTAIRLSEPQSFSEMSPGRHEIRFTKTALNSGFVSEVSLNVRVRPAWYACTAAKVLYVLIVFFIAAVISRSLRARKELENRLRQSEIEKEKSSNFFVDLSYSIRTPLNVIVGMFENFFKEYGRRSAGAEQLEEIYQNSIKVREQLAGVIDSQEALYDDTHTDGEKTRKNVRFINAATGAIERRIFAGEKMDVGELCKELHIGKTQLTAQFREAAGTTPRQFIEDVKLKHAYTLLQEGNMRIGEISSLLNFSSPGYFTSKFKAKYGFPPTRTRSGNP